MEKGVQHFVQYFAKYVDPKTFETAECTFFEDQVTLTWKYVIDTFHVDIEHEARIREQEGEDLQRRFKEGIDENVTNEDTVMGSTNISDTSLNFAVNRSGAIQKTVSTNEIATQTDVNYNLREGTRNFKDSIKILLASSCAEANISPHQARISFKTHSKFFAADYHLSLSSDPPASKKREQKRIIAIMKMYCHHKKPLQG